MKDQTPPPQTEQTNSVRVIQEPYDTILGLLTDLQYKAAKKDLTGAIDTADKIMSILTASNKDSWWITTGFFNNGGLKVLGPFNSQELALEVRTLLEHASQPKTYAVDRAELSKLKGEKP